MNITLLRILIGRRQTSWLFTSVDEGLPRNKSNQWSELDRNPGPPDREPDTLTTRPRCLLKFPRGNCQPIGCLDRKTRALLFKKCRARSYCAISFDKHHHTVPPPLQGSQICRVCDRFQPVRIRNCSGEPKEMICEC